jgi:hypothetical protein
MLTSGKIVNGAFISSKPWPPSWRFQQGNHRERGTELKHSLCLIFTLPAGLPEPTM